MTHRRLLRRRSSAPRRAPARAARSSPSPAAWTRRSSPRSRPARSAPRALAVTAVSPAVAHGRARRRAARGARAIGIAHETIATDELAREGYRAQRPRPLLLLQDRALRRARRARRPPRLRARCCPGANADDAGRLAPRPAGGRRARRRATRCSTRAPARPQVRALARELGIPSADKPATPCLASRIPYGTAVDPETLAQIDRAERAVRALGFPVLRVRHHGILGRVEVAADDLDRALDTRGRDRRRRARRRLPPRRRSTASRSARAASTRCCGVGSPGHDRTRPLRSDRPRVQPARSSAPPRWAASPSATPTGRSSCCSSTASTTSTSPRATATPSCASRTWLRRHEGEFFLATKTGERDLRAPRARRSAARSTASASTTSTRSSCTTSST